MWLTGRLTPDFKTIADFRQDNDKGIRNVCRSFIVLCRQMKLFSQAVVAIDGSKFKAVKSRDRDFSPGKIDARKEQIEQSIRRCLDALETADRVRQPTSKPRPNACKRNSASYANRCAGSTRPESNSRESQVSNAR